MCHRLMASGRMGSIKESLQALPQATRCSLCSHSRAWFARSFSFRKFHWRACSQARWSSIKRPVNTASALLVLHKLTHAQIAILTKFLFCDVIVTILWGKNCNFRLAFLEFPPVKFHKSWQMGYKILFCFTRLVKTLSDHEIYLV